jgi:hypothetical protein
MFKSTRLYSVLFNKCPKCHKGDFFITNNAYNLKTFNKMHANCAVCKQSFEPETGFYIGAMYASYGLTVAYGLALFIAMVAILKIDILIFLISFSISLILLLPWVYRKSRLIWINLFVGYDNNLNT